MVMMVCSRHDWQVFQNGTARFDAVYATQLRSTNGSSVSVTVVVTTAGRTLSKTREIKLSVCGQLEYEEGNTCSCVLNAGRNEHGQCQCIEGCVSCHVATNNPDWMRLRGDLRSVV